MPRSKPDSVFSLYQSQTQSTIPDLVKNDDFIVFLALLFIKPKISLLFNEKGMLRGKSTKF